MNMNFNLTPNFKAIRYFERMTNTSFLEVDKHTEFLPQLLYCCLLVHPENNFKMTFEEACEEFFPQYIDDLVKEFSIESLIINQFVNNHSNEDDSSINTTENSSPAKEEHVYMSSLIPLLIIDCHLDANFVLNDMDYTDTELYFTSAIEHNHSEREDKRFWTYLQVLPHLSSKSGIKEPEDLITFTWEKDKKKKEAEDKLKVDRKRLIELGFIKEDKESLNKEEKS